MKEKPGPQSMQDSRYEVVSVILTSTPGSDEWELSVPVDVPVQALIAKFLKTSALGFTERDESGYLIPYRLLWKERKRYLEEAETLRSACVPEGNTLVMAIDGYTVGRESIALTWETIGVGLVVPGCQTVHQLVLPVDIPAECVVDRLMSDTLFNLKMRDNLNRKIIYRIMWKEGGRALDGAETLRKASVRAGDCLEITPVTAAKPKSAPQPERTRVFISYSQKDRHWLDNLLVHLLPLQEEGLIDPWADSSIDAGMEWRVEIGRALETAQVAVLLVSADFLASKFIRENELPPLLESAERVGTKILPVIVRPCLFEETPAIARYQSVNPPNRPLSSVSANDQEEALVRVARAILTFARRS